MAADDEREDPPMGTRETETTDICEPARGRHRSKRGLLLSLLVSQQPAGAMANVHALLPGSALGARNWIDLGWLEICTSAAAGGRGRWHARTPRRGPHAAATER